MRKYQLVSNYIKNRSRQKKTNCNEDNYDNVLDREFSRTDELDAVVSDLTYVKVAGIWHYICLIADLWNREIIGWSVGKNKDAKLVYQAIVSIKYPLNKINIFHTDRGNEFKNQIIDDVVNAFDLKRSLSYKGTPLDNAVIESTNHILKTEFIYPHGVFSSLDELKTLLFDCIHWYNHDRIHGTLNYMTPIEYREKYQKITPALFYQNLDANIKLKKSV